MKRTFTILLVCLSLLALAACEDGEPTTASVPNTTAAPTTTAHTHSYTETMTAPTCTEKGYTTYTCACGDSYQDKELPATGHQYTESVSKEPSCTADGERLFACSCGESYTEAIEKLEHTYAASVVAPTCTEKGYTTHTCVCGDSYTDTEVEATGHSWQNAACGAAITCGSCGEDSGKLAGHTFTDNTCTCGVAISQDISGIKPMSFYHHYELFEDGDLMEETLGFYNNGTGIVSTGFYFPEPTREDAQTLVYDGKTYYLGSGMSFFFNMKVEGNLVIAEVVNDWTGEVTYYKIALLTNGNILWAAADASWSEAVEYSPEVD